MPSLPHASEAYYNRSKGGKKGKFNEANIIIAADLCLVDIKIPAMSGKELYHWLQSKHPWQAGRVIFTTGDVMGEDTKDFLEQTERPFLTKPFTPGEVRDIMRETLLREVENERRANKSTGG